MIFLVLLIFPIGLAWIVIHGFRKGVVWGPRGSYVRSEDPVLFWLQMAMFAGFSAWAFYLLGPISWDLLEGFIEFGWEPTYQG